MRITIEWLRFHDARPEDIASFNERYPEGVDALTYLRSLIEHNAEWGMWVALRLPEFAQIRSRWLLRVLNNPKYGAIRAAEGDERALGAISAVIALLERDIKGDAPPRKEWGAAMAGAAAAALADGAGETAAGAAAKAAGAVGAVVAVGAAAARTAAGKVVWMAAWVAADWAAQAARRAAAAGAARVAAGTAGAAEAARASATGVTKVIAQLQWLIDVYEQRGLL